MCAAAHKACRRQCLWFLATGARPRAGRDAARSRRARHLGRWGAVTPTLLCYLLITPAACAAYLALRLCLPGAGTMVHTCLLPPVHVLARTRPPSRPVAAPMPLFSRHPRCVRQAHEPGAARRGRAIHSAAARTESPAAGARCDPRCDPHGSVKGGLRLALASADPVCAAGLPAGGSGRERVRNCRQQEHRRRQLRQVFVRGDSVVLVAAAGAGGGGGAAAAGAAQAAAAAAGREGPAAAEAGGG